MSSSRVHTTLTGPSNLLGDSDRRNHHVRLELAAEAAAEQMIVDDHFLDRESGRFRRLRLHPAYDLRAGPDFTGVGLEMNRGIQRLHRRMGEKRKLECGFEFFAGS